MDKYVGLKGDYMKKFSIEYIGEIERIKQEVIVRKEYITNGDRTKEFYSDFVERVNDFANKKGIDNIINICYPEKDIAIVVYKEKE